MSKTYFSVLIDNGSGKHQSYQGWDATYQDRLEAEEAKIRALAAFPSAKVVAADEEEAARFGWLEKLV